MPSSQAAEPRRVAHRDRIQEYLARSVVNPSRIADAYIRSQDIEKAWSGLETIEHALYPAVLSTTEVEFIREQLLTFLSILVYIDAHEFLKDFRANFIHPSGAWRYSDGKLPLKEEDVPSLGSFILRKRFLDEQYLFIPEVLVESATIKQISDQRRLPFESVSKGLFSGAYGTVDKVGISPAYFQNRDGWTYPQVKYVACKRFHAQRPSSYNDTKRELDNLQVLKNRITSHENIRVHLAIILHKGEHFILLPWADHLDLEVFLLEGHDFIGREIYDFKRRFPRIQTGSMINDICTQTYHIADALKWLHEGIISHGTQNRIRFAHMDLKPNNILIDSDDGPSTVGKWVLTDFGISAFKEDDEPDEEGNLISVRDFYQNLTINTTPRRDPGAYQPPEVERMDSKGPERRKTAKEGSAGRRGDIWSFACIFSEVLAFSLGQTTLLKEFRKIRKGRHRNDYFYEVERETLQPDNNDDTSYRVRPQILEWLCDLSERYTFPKRAIDCCVETIQRILIVDGSKRPKAHELLKMLNHVANHVNSARAPGGFPPGCPLEHPSPLPSPAVESVLPGASNHLPAITIQHDEDSRVLPYATLFNTVQGYKHDGASASTAEIAPHIQIAPHMPPWSPTPFRDREDSLLGSGQSSTLNNDAITGLGISSTLSDGTPTIVPSRPDSRESKRDSRRESRRDLHGIMVNADKIRKVGAAVELMPPDFSKRKVVSFHLCPTGLQVVYLIEPKKSQYEIRVYQVDKSFGKLSMGYQSFPMPNLNPIPLPSGTLWEHVVTCERYIVAWGRDTLAGARRIYLTNHIASTVWCRPDPTWLATLVNVAVSKRGSLAFICTKSILYTVLDGDSKDFLDINLSYFQEIIPAKSDHSFTHAAFNDDGSLLYAWEFGRPDDCMSVWRVSNVDNKLVLPIDSEGSYPSKQQGSGTATIIPYNSYHGCIIHAQGDAFFPAQIRSTQRGSTLTLEKKIVSLPKTVATCIYGDHSLLVTVKGTFHTRVWEHQIVGGAMHVIEPAKEPIIELKCRTGDDVQMRVVPVPERDELVIVLSMLDGRFIIVPVVADSLKRSGSYSVHW